MLEVLIVDRETGARVKTSLFLKLSRNVVKGYPTILRTAIQSNAMVTKETVVRCPVGWNTRLRIGLECSYRKRLTEGGVKHAWFIMNSTSDRIFITGSERENDSCKGYRQYLRHYDDDTDVNLGTTLICLRNLEIRLVCGHMIKVGRSFRSSLRQGKPATWRRETDRFNAVRYELSRRKDV